MNEDYTTPDMPLIAAVAEKQVHESRRRIDQVIKREVQDAMERKQFEVATALADAGVPVNRFDNTPEGARALAWCMKLMDIQIQKLVFQDDFRRSGYYIYRMGQQAGFVPCEIVRGVMI